jgi:hypothetical protein
VYNALLFRLNPKYWPHWQDDIAQDREPYPLLEVGDHLELSELCAGIPVIALGTDGLGIVAIGKTVSKVEHCADDDLSGVAEEDRVQLEEVRPRIRAKFHFPKQSPTLQSFGDLNRLVYWRKTLNVLTLED